MLWGFLIFCQWQKKIFFLSEPSWTSSPFYSACVAVVWSWFSQAALEPLQTADVLHLWVVLQAHWNGSFHWVFIDLCNYCKKEANTAVIESRMCFWLRDLNTSVLIAVCWVGLLKMTQNCGIMNPSPEIKSVPCPCLCSEPSWQGCTPSPLPSTNCWLYLSFSYVRHKNSQIINKSFQHQFK